MNPKPRGEWENVPLRTHSHLDEFHERAGRVLDEWAVVRDTAVTDTESTNEGDA